MPKKSSAAGLTVDFSGVETGGGRSVANGTYRIKVVEVTSEVGGDSGKEYLKWTYVIEKGQNHAGSKLYDNTSLQPQALWKLRGLLESFGVSVAGRFNLEPLRQWTGKITTAIVENEDYEGKQKPRIAEYVVKVDDDGSEAEGEEAEGEEAEETTFKKGDKVKFTEDGKTFKGVVVSVEDETATVDVSGDEWELDVSDLSLR